MLMDDIKLWAVDGSNGAVPVAAADRMESERLLEETLVDNPDLLMPGLTIVGRQAPTDGGPLDLLGVDEDGRLVVFELKRGSLTREAVAQIIDYASGLDSMADGDLAQFIIDKSGQHGVPKRDDLEGWYESRWEGQGLSALRPVRMFLVGLGVDERTNRMVRFLAKSGVDISLLTFHGYTHDGKTLLARQVRVEPESGAGSGSRTPTARSRQRELIEGVENRIEQQVDQWEEGCRVWNAARQMLRENLADPRERASRADTDWARYRINFSLRLRGRRHYAGVQLSPWNQSVEIIFFRAAVQLCLEEFTKLRKEIPYFTYPEDDPAKEEGVIEVKFVMKSMIDWETHKEKLASAARSVYQANEAQLRSDDSNDC